MDSKKQSDLIKKYWEGQTTPEEEKALFSSDLDQIDLDEQAHFSQIKAFTDLELDANFESKILNEIAKDETAIIRPLWTNMIWKVAAIFLLGLSFYFLTAPNTAISEPTIVAAEEDPEKAFEIAKQALLLVSTELNKASEIDVGLDKFEETKAKIRDDKH